MSVHVIAGSVTDARCSTALDIEPGGWGRFDEGDIRFAGGFTAPAVDSTILFDLLLQMTVVGLAARLEMG